MAVYLALESPLGPAACEKDAKGLQFFEEMTRNADMYGHAFGIDPTVATFAGAALPVVKMPSEGSENSIEVSSCCGCPNPCKCDPCHCEGSVSLNPNTTYQNIFVSAALPVKRPSEGSENSIEVPSCSGPACGCSPSCDCKPECHC